MPARYKILSVIWFYQVAFNMDRIAIAFVGPVLIKSMSMGPQTLGAILSAFALGYMALQIPGGILADRWRLKSILLTLPLLWALFTGATMLMSTITGFILVRLCLGLAEGFAVPAIFRIVASSFGAQERTGAMAISSTASAIGPAIAGPIIGLVMAAHGWRAVFLVLMIPPLVAAALIHLFVPSMPAADRSDRISEAGLRNDQAEASLGRLLSHPSLWVCMGAFFGFNVAYWGYQGWMPTYLATARHIDLKHLGFIGGVPYLLAFVGLLAFGFLGTALNRWRSQMLALTYVLAGLSLYLAFGSASVMGAVVGLSSASFFLSGGIPLFSSLLYELAPRKGAASYAGIVFTAGQVGGFVAPFTIGALVQKTGSFASGFGVMEIALIAAAIGMILLPLLTRPRRGPGETQLSVAA